MSSTYAIDVWVDDDGIQVVEVGDMIAQGPPGPTGPVGPAGPVGTLNVVELNQAEYDALANKAPNTIYVII